MEYTALCKGLLKQAALKPGVELKDYQQRAANKIKEQGSLVVAHGTGTGKTVTSIAGVEALRNEGKAGKVLVVVPASLKTNFAYNGLKKFTTGVTHQIIETGKDNPKNKDYLIVSNTMFAKDPERYLQDRDTLILDEGHNARNTRTQLYESLKSVLPKLKNRVVLTASPFNNSPGDLASLLNLVKDDSKYTQGGILSQYVKPITKKKLFSSSPQVIEEEFVPDEMLTKDLKTFVDYEPGKEDLPEVERSVVKVPMTPEQKRVYSYAWEALPPKVRAAIKKDLLPERNELFSFFGHIAHARLASNNPSALLKKPVEKPYTVSGKALYIKDSLPPADPKLGDIIYSNYSEHGVDVLSQMFDDEGISYSKIKGGMKSQDKDAEIEKFKKGKAKVFLTTPTGKEGISIPNARGIVIHDPHWNPEVTRQAMGRGVRFDSIADKVYLKELLAVTPPQKNIFGKTKPRDNSVEEWIKSVSDKKLRLQKQVYSYFGS